MFSISLMALKIKKFKPPWTGRLKKITDCIVNHFWELFLSESLLRMRFWKRGNSCTFLTCFHCWRIGYFQKNCKARIPTPSSNTRYSPVRQSTTQECTSSTYKGSSSSIAGNHLLPSMKTSVSARNSWSRLMVHIKQFKRSVDS